MTESTPTHYPEIADSLGRIADTIAREIHLVSSETVLREMLDIHADAVRFQQAIESDIPVSIDAVEVLLARASALPKR